MKKVVLGVVLTTLMSVGFSGCGGMNGMAINTMGGNKVDRYFKNGMVVKQRKAIINDRELAIVVGAGAGAVVGSAANQTKGGILGGVIGGITGAIIGNEVVAFETSIKSDDEIFVGYLKEELINGTVVEFTMLDGKMKNVDVIGFKKKVDTSAVKNTTTEAKKVVSETKVSKKQQEIVSETKKPTVKKTLVNQKVAVVKAPKVEAPKVEAPKVEAPKTFW